METTDSITDYAIGIDLGTTYSAVGIYRNNKVDILSNEHGERTTPSYVAFNAEERIIGKSAKNQASSNPTNTIYDVKRLIGRKFTESVIQNELQNLSYKITPDKSKLGSFVQTSKLVPASTVGLIVKIKSKLSNSDKHDPFEVDSR